jgi:RND family efflux transporter MFP subunit
MTTGKKYINLLFAPLIIIIAVLGIMQLIKMRKPTPPRVAIEAVPHVEILESSTEDVVPSISTFGKVRAYQQSSITGQVAGRIESIEPNFDPGRSVKAGELLAKIEEADYKTALAERQSALTAAAQKLADEETRSRIASEDWLASGRSLDSAPEFTLRKPQLASARAALDSAEAAVQQAQLNLQRTSIRAPFDAIVETREASPGNVVTAGASLGTLIARDKAEVRLPLTPEQAARLKLPLAFVEGEAKPLPVTLRDPNRPALTWQASITRTEAAVDTKNRVLYVIAEIPAPFEKSDSFLPVGTFVTAEFTGHLLKGVHRIIDSALIDNAFVWLVSPDNKLRRQPVERLLSDKGDLLLRINEPIAPMPLRIVIRPLASFRDGDNVTITPSTAEKPSSP